MGVWGKGRLLPRWDMSQCLGIAFSCPDSGCCCYLVDKGQRSPEVLSYQCTGWPYKKCPYQMLIVLRLRHLALGSRTTRGQYNAHGYVNMCIYSIMCNFKSNIVTLRKSVGLSAHFQGIGTAHASCGSTIISWGDSKCPRYREQHSEGLSEHTLHSNSRCPASTTTTQGKNLIDCEA